MFLLTSVLALGVIVSSNVVKAEDDEKPTIKGIMKATHAGDKSLKAKATKAVKAKDWEAAETAAKEWVKHAEALSKTTPSKGTAASWKKMTASYEKNVKALAAAADKKDTDGAKDALGKLGKSCGSCHGAHKPKDE
jgi:cytochrome c556